MSQRRPLDRRALGQVLTRLAHTKALELPEVPALPAGAQPARRIGFTGAPGAGKSTLVGRLALKRTAECRVGVLAIDPTSPRSGGAILGDRIRMDEVDDSGGLYVRSVASKSATDGLADHAPEMLAAMEAFGFDELLLETVGVGQAEQAVRQVVDTLVLVVPPDAGDYVQAMKAGIAELADIVVVSKADLPGAQHMAANVTRVVAATKRPAGSWVPRVLLASSHSASASSIAAISQAIDEHSGWLHQSEALPRLRLARARYGLLRIVERLGRRVVDAQDPAFFAQPLPQQVQAAIELIARQAAQGPRSNHQETAA